MFDKMLQSFIELLGLVLAHGLGLGLFSEIISNNEFVSKLVCACSHPGLSVQ